MIAHFDYERKIMKKLLQIWRSWRMRTRHDINPAKKIPAWRNIIPSGTIGIDSAGKEYRWVKTKTQRSR